MPRVGAARLLALQPGLVPTCLEAMGQHLISSSVASFFLALLAQLQREARAAGGTGEGAATAAAVAASSAVEVAGQADWRASWMQHLVAALCSGSESQRDHLAAHLLPQLLSADPPALGLLLQQLLPGGSGQGGGASSEGAAAGCLAVLKAARKQQLLCDLDSLPVAGLDAAAVRSALLAAVRSSSEGLRCASSWARMGHWLGVDGPLSAQHLHGCGCKPAEAHPLHITSASQRPPVAAQPLH